MQNRILSKAEAWVTRDDLRYTPIRNRREYRFRRRWFLSRNCATFSTFLPSRFPPAEPWKVLTIGVFEAMSEVWLFQNILQHADSFLVGIDPWLSYEHHRPGMDQTFADQCYAAACYNLGAWKGRWKLLVGKSQDVLPAALIEGNLAGVPVGTFDLAIIDGDHAEDAVYTDAVNCFDLVKSGGWLLFDDVRTRTRKVRQVREGLTRFLEAYDDRVRQVWSHRFCECYEKLIEG